MLLQLTKRTMQRAAATTALAVASLSLSGCQAVTNDGITASQLRIIDASVDAGGPNGGIDIYANKSVLTYNLGFGTITSYIPITPGTYTLTADQSNSTSVLASARATLAPAKQSTLLIGNVLAGLQATLLADQSTPAPSGQINVRIIDQATKVGAVDIYVVPSGSTLLTVNPIAVNVPFGGNTGYLNFPVGTYKLYVVATGTVISDTTVPLFSGDAVTYPQGCARTVILLDQQIVTMPGVQVITANDYDLATATS